MVFNTRVCVCVCGGIRSCTFFATMRVYIVFVGFSSQFFCIYCLSGSVTQCHELKLEFCNHPEGKPKKINCIEIELSHIWS